MAHMAKGAVRGKNTSRGAKSSTSRTLSSTRQQNYSITPSVAPRVSKRNRPQIDYLSLNDGLDEDTPTSPKQRKRNVN